ncbi:MAG: RNA polymerase sigma factor [Bacteroidales bacterium]|jgi:RNA polymerase sigma-70 factor (ECF subfamily)
MTDDEIIEGCRKFRKDAQKALYEKYVCTFRAICRRYTADTQDANDILHDCFIKIFTKIDQYAGNGSFEGWMKRIIINACITWFKDKRVNGQYLKIDDIKDCGDYDDNGESEEESEDVRSTIQNANFTKEEIQQAVDLLPEGYKMVFFLYVFENYKHHEIARELNIDANTSKSQLSRARKLLQKKLMELCKAKVLITS